MRKNFSNDDRYDFILKRFAFAHELFESFRVQDKLGVYDKGFQKQYSEILDMRKGFRAAKMLQVEQAKATVNRLNEAKFEMGIVINEYKDKQDALVGREKELYDKIVVQFDKMDALMAEAVQDYKNALIDGELFFRSECKAAKRNHHNHFTKKILKAFMLLKEA